MPLADPPLAARIALAMGRVAQAQRTALQAVATERGLSPLQIQILDVLAAGEPPEPRTQAIARELGVGQPTLTESINALQEKGLVTRTFDPLDRRRTALGLTEAGVATIGQLGAVPTALEDAILGLPAAIQEQLLEGVVAVVDALHAKGAIPAARTCTSCANLDTDARRCRRYEIPIRRRDLRVDCPAHVRR
jgi:DNA-binding MarR family transcriptional regulator